MCVGNCAQDSSLGVQLTPTRDTVTLNPETSDLEISNLLGLGCSIQLNEGDKGSFSRYISNYWNLSHSRHLLVGSNSV